jgi:hypothetical protein
MPYGTFTAAFLPRELRPLLSGAPEPAEPFGLDELIRRVAELGAQP